MGHTNMKIYQMTSYDSFNNLSLLSLCKRQDIELTPAIYSVTPAIDVINVSNKLDTRDKIYN